MRRLEVSGLVALAVMTTFWAYTVIDSLIRKFSQNITYIDLGVIFILGLIAGAALGVALLLGVRQPRPE